MNHKMESRLPGEILKPQMCDDAAVTGENEGELKEPLDEDE